MTSAAVVSAHIMYPESDGKPVGESDVHRREILAIIDMLERYYQDVDTIYVSGNLMFYYEEGEPSSVVSPDVFVVKGIAKKLRRSYKLWDEKHVPCAVFEITSRSTRIEDKGNKQALYAMLGVREYFMFDPLAEYLRPALQGFALTDTGYAPLLPDAEGALISQELGLRLWSDNNMLCLADLRSGKRLLRSREVQWAREAAEEAREAAEERALEEQQAREAAEERVHRLEAELQQLRNELDRLRS